MAFEALLFFSIHRGPLKGLGSSKCGDLKDRHCNYLATLGGSDLQGLEKRPSWGVQTRCYHLLGKPGYQVGIQFFLHIKLAIKSLPKADLEDDF